jgi:hypothetical protein
MKAHLKANLSNSKMALYKSSWAQGWTAKVFTRPHESPKRPHKGLIRPFKVLLGLFLSTPGPFQALDIYTEPYVVL